MKRRVKGNKVFVRVIRRNIRLNMYVLKYLNVYMLGFANVRVADYVEWCERTLLLYTAMIWSCDVVVACGNVYAFLRPVMT